ncbi:fibronectin type III domain-containing protein [Emticicia sp. 17c]|uniref:fibronectin type III domain-containing protein n=1 Tax=Emticicia sp. 17c TaxID=3127704 RepID=UPI00301D5184
MQNEQVRIIADIIKRTEPTVFHGDLEVAIQKYQEKGTEIASKGTITAEDKQDLLTYTQGIQGAISTWKDKFSEVFGWGETDPKIGEILGDMTAILTQLKADKTSMEGGTPPAGTSYPTIPDLKTKIDVIIEKIKSLQQDNAPKPPRIQNVVATNIGYNDATLTWQGDPRFTKYVISYKTADGGELIETVNSNRLDLKNLQENSQYGFRIEAYVGDEVVSTYENGEFKTLTQKLPPPINLISTKLTGKSIKLSWDKDPKHKSYKLIYRSRDGELHTVFPQTNQVIIDNLDPTEVYPYEVIALSDNLVSDAANSDFTTGLVCSVSLKASSLNISKGEQTTLTASCGGTLNWYNGGEDIGVVQGSILSWQNGENGTISSDRKTLIITPLQNTTYTAICEVTDGIETKSCTSASLINVQPEICKNFVINPSKEVIQSGSLVSISASGCNGSFAWDNGLGVEKSLAFRVIEKTMFTARCSTTEGTCVATASIDIEKKTSCSSYELGGKYDSYKCGGILDGFLFGHTCDNYEYYIYSSTGNVNDIKNISYEFQGNADETSQYEKKFYAIDVDGAFTVIATFSDGMNTCKISDVGTTKTKNCDFSISQKTETDGGITLTQVGCSAGNTVKWDDGTGGINGVLTQQPSITVPPISKNYTAICGRNSCLVRTHVETPIAMGLLITSQDLSGKPKIYTDYITGKPSNIPATEYPVKIDALYCNGNLTWSSSPQVELNINNNSISISTPPIQTTTYTATCIKNNIVMQQSVTLNISSKSCFAIEAPATIEIGEDATLTVTENSGCMGDITWYQGDIQIDEGTEIFVTPLQSTTYTAKCSNPQCAESVTVKVKPCSLAIASSTGKNSVKMGETITLAIEGCSAGTINWQGGDADGEIGNEISIRPFEKTTYTATCDIVEGCSKTITIDVITDLPPKIPCENFILTANKTEANIADNATLTASGCTGGTISWPNNSTIISANTAKVTITICGENNYVATCQNAGQTGTAQVKINGKLNFTVEPIMATIAVNSGKSVTLTAKGCLGGNVVWHGPENDGTTTAINSVTKVGEYTATCNIPTCTPLAQKVTVTYSCPGFVLNASPAFIKPNTSATVTFTAKGCEGGEIIWWDNTRTTSMTKTISNVVPPKTYKAICSFCPQNEVSAIISEDIPPNPEVCAPFQAIASTTTFIEGDAPITLQTIGYNCKGAITWSDGQVGNFITVNPNNNITYQATCTSDGASCPSRPVSINVIKCSDFDAYAMPSYSTTANIVVSNCYGNITWNGAMVGSNVFEVEIPDSYKGVVGCDRPKCTKTVTIQKQECPTLKWTNDNTYPSCKIVNGYTHYYYKYTLQNACPYYKIVDLLKEDVDLKDTQGNRPIIEFVSVGDVPSKLIVRCFEDQTFKKEVCRTPIEKAEYLPDLPSNCFTNSINSRITQANNTVTFCNTPLPMSKAASGYLAKLCEDIGQLKDDDGNSFLKNPDGTMSEANAKQMIALVEQALKNSGNSDLSNFTTPTDQVAILAALQAGNCTVFGTEMAKGYSNIITAGGYNTSILSTFEETERTALKALYQLPDAIKAILARIRQGNIDKKESVSISNIIHNYEIAFGMVKKKDGIMEYYQPLVLSDGITTVSAIQLLFSDNIVKVNPVPLPPAVDISLKDKSEDNNTIIYGSIKTSSNWISITDTKTDEFKALKQ